MRLPLRIALLELQRQPGRLLLLALALAVGFGAFFTTDAFSARVLRGVATESRALLGGDVVVRVRGSLPEGLQERVAALPGVVATTLQTDFLTMAGSGPETAPLARLVEIRAVVGDYPLAGKVEATAALPRPLQGLWVDRALAEAWNLRPAEPLRVVDQTLVAIRQALRLGGQVVPIQGIVSSDDSRTAGTMAIFPRLLLDGATAARLGLMGARARMESRLLVLLGPGVSLEQAVGRIRGVVGADVRVQGHLEAAGNLARPIRNITHFVRMLGLLTLVLAAMGAWAILASFLESKTREAAILRCLGASPAVPVRAFILLAALLLLVALVLGYALGLAAAAALPRLLGGMLPALLKGSGIVPPPWVETAVVVSALGLLLLPTFMRLASVHPLALLRDSTTKATWARPVLLAPFGAALLGGLLVVRNAPDLTTGIGAAVALGALLGGLWGVARLLVALYRRLLDRLPLSLRLGLGQLGARPALSALLMAVIGLAVFLTLSASFVKEDLVAPLAQQRGKGQRPNLFMVDVPPESRLSLETRIRAKSGHPVMSGPMVRARLLTVAGRPAIHAHGRQREGAEEMRTREQNLSWRDQLAPSEEVVEGRFWPQDGSPRAEVSLERFFAQSIGAKLGDELVFDVSGQPVKGRVTSLRKVRWTTMQVNFFILLHPSLLEGAPAMWIMAAEVDDASARSALQAEIAAAHPTVTVVDVGEVVARVGRVMDLIAMVARVLAALMLTSALLVLASSLMAGRVGRARDIALLRAVGASDTTLHQSLAWEFMVMGGSAAGLAAVGAWFAARLYATRILELDSHPSWVLGCFLMALSALLTLLVGWLGTRKALSHKPLEMLRGE